ncbi:hypothetical protein ACFL51_01460 [Myxococcota bacterium]
MSASNNLQQRLSRLFNRSPVADLQTIQQALGTGSRTTVFRLLVERGYYTSYSHAGRYYTLAHIPQFDAEGLWSYQEALFSKDHTLRATIVRIVHQAPAGKIHAELRALLRLRVQDTLRQLTRDGQIGRVKLQGPFLYVSPEQDRAQRQIQQRRQRLQEQPSPVPPPVIIEVLLEVLHHANVRADPEAVAERLNARGLTVSAVQVEEVFARHGIEKKTPHSRSGRSRH